MAVDGNWNLTMSTPMGDRNATLSLKNADGALTGTQAAEGNSTEIFDGTANGDDVAWKVSITNPMPLTLAPTLAPTLQQELALALQQVLGIKRGNYMSYTNQGIDAETCLKLGAVNEVVADGSAGRSRTWIRYVGVTNMGRQRVARLTERHRPDGVTTRRTRVGNIGKAPRSRCILRV